MHPNMLERDAATPYPAPSLCVYVNREARFGMMPGGLKECISVL